MLRSGSRRHTCRENSGFVSASVSSDEMLLNPVEKTSPVAKKQLRKKSKTDKKGVMEQSSGEEPAVSIKKKRSKRSKNDAEERKIVRGARRLQRQQAIEEVAGTKKVSLRSYVKSASSEDKENEQSAIDQSLNLSAMHKSSRNDKSPKLSTKNKNKHAQLDDYEESRKVLGARKLQRQHVTKEVTDTDGGSLRSNLRSASSEDKENGQSAIDESINLGTMDKSNRKDNSSLKSPTKSKKKLMEVTDENLIETSVGKYTQSTRLLYQKERLNAFDETIDSSIVEDSMDSSKEFLNGYLLKDLKKNKNNAFEMPNPVMDTPANVLNSCRRDTFDVKTSKCKKRSFDIVEKPAVNAFDESLDDSLDSPTFTPTPKTNNRSKSVKRSTFEVDKDGDANEEPKTKKRNTREVKIGTLPVKSPAKTTGKKRSTFPIKIEKPHEMHDNETGTALHDAMKKRESVDINANGVSPKKRGIHELEPDVTRKTTNSPTSKSFRRETTKKDVKKTPTLAVRRSISSMHRKKVESAIRDEKIKISDSKTSLTESCISSPSMLLRRAQMLNPPSKPATPKISTAQQGTAKKKTPNLNRSISKVKKVPNYTAIHQNAYNKMESIDDHLQRKADRAKALLSGQKVPLAAKRTSRTQDAKNKKQLFSTSLSDATNLPTKANFKFTTKTTNSPMTFGLSHGQLAAGDASVLDASAKRDRNKKAVGFSVATSVMTRSNAKLPKTPRPTKQEIWNAYGTKIPRAAPHAAQPSMPPNVLFTMGKESPAVGKPAMPPKNLRLKQVTSVSTKSKGSTSTVDSRRDHIKGVRSNRRFDLLMSMRK